MKSYIKGEQEGFTQEEFEDIKICIETLLSVRAGSQPLDREFGIDYEKAVSYPPNVVENILSVEIIEKIKKYEPRVSVDSVQFSSSENGNFYPCVHFVKAFGG